MAEKKLLIPWGREEISWNAPEGVVLPQPRGERPARGTPEDALNHPVGSPPLRELAAKARRITVVLPDGTRLWQNVPLMARALRQEIAKAGDAEVTWLVGGGLHRAPTEDEISLLAGDALLPGDRIFWADPGRVRTTGLATSRGTPVAVAPEALDADLLVLAGGIVYHDLAGFSGGRKGILPAISGRESVQNNHRLSIARGLEGLEVNAGRLEGNATAEDMEEYRALVETLVPLFLLNVIPDDTGRPYCYTAGSAGEAWRRGVDFARALQTLYIPERAALVVVSSGGYPCDIDLYQATKSVTATLSALLPGGGLLLCAGLEDGMGPGSFARDFPLSLKDRGALLQQLEEDFTIPGFIALKVPHDLEGHPSVLVTPREGIPFPGKTFSSLEKGLEWILPRIPKGPVVFVPSGNGVFLKADA